MTDAPAISRILTLVFTDLADSTALKTQRGDQAVGALSEVSERPGPDGDVAHQGMGMSPGVGSAALRQAGLE